MSGARHNKDTLRELLEQGCGCKYYGPTITPPLRDMTELYGTPDGLLYFSVPPSDNDDGTYSDMLIQLIIDVHNLSVKPYKATVSAASTPSTDEKQDA